MPFKKKFLTKENIFCLVYSFLFAFACSAGKCYDRKGALSGDFKNFFLPLILITVGTFICLTIGRMLWKRIEIKLSTVHVKEYPKTDWIKVAIPILIWSVGLLGIFPGIFSYDSEQEYEQVRDMAITSHHPVLHVVILGELVNLFEKLGNANVGIFLYVLIQLALYAYVLSKLVKLFRKTKMREWLQWVLILFYAFSPVLELMSISTTKDAVFTAFELWLCIIFLDRRTDPVDSRLKKSQLANLIIASLGTMIFRKNGIYMAIVASVIFFLHEKVSKKALAVSYIIIAAVYMCYVGPFYKLLNVEAGSTGEALSIPIQQLARVHKYDRGSFPEEDLQTLYEVIPEEYWDAYIDTVSDPVKAGFNDEAFKENGLQFIKIWIKTGIKHPEYYLGSFLVITHDYWYPLAIFDGYKGIYGLSIEESNYYSYFASTPAEEQVILPSLHEYFTKISVYYKVGSYLPCALLMNPAWYLFLWLGCVFVDIIKNNKLRTEVHVFLGIGLLTVFMGPIAQVRYIFFIYASLPLYFVSLPASPDGV